MILLAENETFKVEHEYEEVYLYNKRKKKRTLIGDFYGDPNSAIIGFKNDFCAMCGCGIIVYYLHKPYKPYEYNLVTRQWKEYYRDGERWFDSLYQIDESLICAITEYGERIVIEIKL